VYAICEALATFDSHYMWWLWIRDCSSLTGFCALPKNRLRKLREINQFLAIFPEKASIKARISHSSHIFSPSNS
jgi:hypothetical protein